MPRKARSDAPGALHHIIVRGIDRTALMGKVARDRQEVESILRLFDGRLRQARGADERFVAEGPSLSAAG